MGRFKIPGTNRAYTTHRTKPDFEKASVAFIEKLKGLDEAGLRKHANDYIWLSAFASNNGESDYHWMCDLTYDECVRRGREDIYTQEHERLSKQ